jgi:hypothetical protein
LGPFSEDLTANPESGKGFRFATSRPPSASFFSVRGFTTFEVFLLLVLLAAMIAAVVPAYLSARQASKAKECSLRLGVIREAKRDVMRDMNLLLPKDQELVMGSRINQLHIDKIAQITLASPWRFHPDDPCPMGGKVSVGQTFLDQPSCSCGQPVGDISLKVEE